MKINNLLLSILIVSILVLPFTSAWGTGATENFKKSPSQKYGEVTLSDSLFGLPIPKWLGGNDLAKVELEDNTDFCRTDCKARGTTDLYDGGTLFDALEFSNIYDHTINRDYEIWIIKKENVKVPEYGQVCTTEKVMNNFTLTLEDATVCKTEKTGEKNEQQYVRDYQYTGQNLPVGKYSWEISGRKQAQENVDWKPTIKGFKINRWAWWIGVQPLAYWQFNNASGNATDTSGNNYVLENINQNATYLVGKLFNATRFTGNATYFNKTIPTLGRNNFTIAFWINRSGIVPSPGNEIIITSAEDLGSPNGIFYALFEAGRKGAITFAVKDSNGDDYSTYSNFAVNTSQWQRVVITKEAGNISIYINGTISNSTSSSTALNLTPAGGGNNLVNMTLGNTGTVRSYPLQNASLDDIQIFNISWTQEDVTEDWNGGVGKEADDTPVSGASVTLTQPANNTLFTVNTIGFNATLTPLNNENLTNATVQIYSGGSIVATNMTNLSGNVTVAINLNISNLADGIYFWNVLTGTSNYTGGAHNYSLAPNNFSFTIDTIAPTADYGLGTDTNNSYLPRNFTIINVTSTDASVSNITIYLINTTGLYFNTTNATNSLYINITNLLDGVYYFNATVTDAANQKNHTQTRTITVDNTRPLISFIADTPLNASNQTSSSLLLNVAVTETNEANISFSFSNSSGLINLTTLSAGIRNITFTLPREGVYYFNASIRDLANNFNSTETRTIVYSNTTSNITIQAPTQIVRYFVSGTNLTFNWTISDPLLNITSCFYDFNGVNTTLNVNQCRNASISNNITFVTPREYVVYANNSNNLQGRNKTQWNYTLFEYNRPYHPLTFGLTPEAFMINLTYDQNAYNSISATLNYNNTLYNPVTVGASSNIVFNATVTIPNTISQINNTFYWQILLSNATGVLSINTSLINQSVMPVTIDNCTTNTYPILNFTLNDENSRTVLNGTIEAIVSLYTSSTSAFLNFSANATNQTLVLCITNFTNANMNYQTKYYAPNHFAEYKYAQNISVNNVSLPQLITLYDLINTSVSNLEFKITYRDSTLIPVSGALIDIQRQYVPINQFLSVETPITDSQGSAVAHLEQSSVVYNLMVTKNGQLLGTFNNVVAFCQTLPCTISLDSTSSTISVPNYQNYQNVNYAISVNNNTRDVVVIYTTTDSTSKNISLRIVKNDGYSNNTVCVNSQLGASGAITCNIPHSFGNSSFVTSVFVNSVPVTTVFTDVGGFTSGQIFGNSRIFLAMLLYMSLALLFIANPVAMVIGGMVGLGLSSALFLLEGGGLFATGVFMGWFIIAGVIVIWQLRRL